MELNIVHSGSVLAVLEAFLSRVNYHLVNGRAVDLGQLGTFYPSIQSSGEDAAEDVDRNNIRRFHVVFRPSGILKKRMSQVEFSKIAQGRGASEPDEPANE